MTTSDSAFNWDEEVEFQGEILCADQLDRAKYAEFLTSYLNSAGQRDEGYVINLNAEWGAGKTWFLKRWCKELEKNHPVAYIDAWKNDFSDDPLVTVVEGIISALEALDTSQTDLKDGFVEQVSNLWKNSRAALNRGGPALIKGILRAQAGIDTADILEDAVAESIGDFLKDALGEQKAQVESLEQSRNIIREWINKVAPADGENSQQPMYVFIDELDRCRPTYAIELLETVKHLFEIKGIVFVIATNTDQLQHSIKAVYGEGFDANRYLYRFFNRSFALAQPEMSKFISSASVTNELWSVLEKTYNDSLWFEKQDDMVELFASIAKLMLFDLRTTLQWLDQCKASLCSSAEVTNKYLWPYLIVMIAVKLDKPELFDSLYVTRKSATQSGKNSVVNFNLKIMEEQYPEYLGRIIAGIEGHVFTGFCCKTTDMEFDNPERISIPTVAPVSLKISVQLLFDASFMFVKAEEYEFPKPRPDQNTGAIEINFSHFWSQKVADTELIRKQYINLVDMASDLE